MAVFCARRRRMTTGWSSRIGSSWPGVWAILCVKDFWEALWREGSTGMSHHGFVDLAVIGYAGIGLHSFLLTAGSLWACSVPPVLFVSLLSLAANCWHLFRASFVVVTFRCFRLPRFVVCSRRLRHPVVTCIQLFPCVWELQCVRS